MNKRFLVFVVSTLILASGYTSEAQQLRQVPRIGFLTAGSASTIPARIEALREGLSEFGYVEDKNIVIEWRFAEGKPDRLPGLVAELLRLTVEAIVTAGPTVTLAAKEAPSPLPTLTPFPP